MDLPMINEATMESAMFSYFADEATRQRALWEAMGKASPSLSPAAIDYLNHQTKYFTKEQKEAYLKGLFDSAALMFSPIEPIAPNLAKEMLVGLVKAAIEQARIATREVPEEKS